MTSSDLRLLMQVRERAADGTARQLRQSAQLSRAELAAAIGVLENTLGSWETGRRRPRGAAALRYARVLDSLVRQTSHAKVTTA